MGTMLKALNPKKQPSDRYDCFICYASQDERFALAVANDLRLHGVSVFIARLSIAAGANWSDAVAKAMRRSEWVIFLGSKHARESPYAQQEVGAAVFGRKRFIPIVWDCAPSDLPGWAKNYQAIDLRGMTPLQIRDNVIAIARAVKATKEERATAGLVATALVFGLFAAAAASGDEKRRPRRSKRS
jgi:hypothetical protein